MVIDGRCLDRRQPDSAGRLERDAGRTGGSPGPIQRLEAIEVPDERFPEAIGERLRRNDGAAELTAPLG